MVLDDESFAGKGFACRSPRIRGQALTDLGRLLSEQWGADVFLEQAKDEPGSL